MDHTLAVVNADILVTSSSAVAKRSCDASCLSVVSFVALTAQYLERRFFSIISHFSFGFTSAYNSILFCCLQRNVEPCCHTHDSRSTVLGRSRTVHSNGRRRLLIARRARSSNTRSKQITGHNVRNTNHGAAVINRKDRYSLRIEILAYPTCI